METGQAYHGGSRGDLLALDGASLAEDAARDRETDAGAVGPSRSGRECFTRRKRVVVTLRLIGSVWCELGTHRECAKSAKKGGGSAGAVGGVGRQASQLHRNCDRELS